MAVVSPSCRRQTRRQQHMSPASHSSPLKHNQQQASPGRSYCSPSTRPRRRSTAHKNASANKTSQSPDPLLTNHKQASRENSNHPITSTQPIQSPRTAATCLPNSSYAEITTPILHRPKQAPRRRCPIQKQPRAASIDRLSYHRRAARRKQVVSPPYISPATNKQLP